MCADYHTRVVRSALWSAYGDALGFITELRDNRNGIFSRIGNERATQTVSWKRRVGGRFGVEAVLPAGCYSDDTQLRLATCRSIRPDASFNVEAFAKMELPVWMSYALGAGRGSKAAALSLSREGVTWFSNFYDSEGLSYFSGGGNGAAMRIQPHVWASSERVSSEHLIAKILRNSICTHGHIRGIVGAVFHGICLQHARLYAAVPGFEEWEKMVNGLSVLVRIVEDDSDLKTFWLPVWEKHSGTKLYDACLAVQRELLDDIGVLRSIVGGVNKEENYHLALQRLGGFTENQRGSGTKTALLASFLAYLFRENGPEQALICAANALASDTDTIATMAGAIMGYITTETPTHEIEDKNYIVKQAERMASIGIGKPTEQTNYPNLLNWRPPRTQQDSVVQGERGLELLVLGRVAEEGQKFEAKKNDTSVWQWLALESGQTVLAKRRRRPFKIGDQQKVYIPMKSMESVRNTPSAQVPLLFEAAQPSKRTDAQSPDIDDLSRRAINSKFDPTMIGEHILQLVSLTDGIEKVIAYSAIIAKARLARTKRGW
jgi:ADP-ribosylglycohydrolase